jgi:serralysin
MRWNYGAPLGTPAIVTYSFLQSVPAYYEPDEPERNGFAPFSAAQMDGARRALALISEVANITFVETAGVADITFGTALFDPAIQAYTYFPLLIEPSWQQQGDI